MESTPWSLTTSANSAASVDFPDWARLRNAVREPVREMIAVEIDTDHRARAVIAGLLAIAPSRPHHVLEFDAVRAEPREVLAAARAATAGWPSEQGLLFVLDTSRPRPGEDDAPAAAFWEGMNSLREQWDALDCQTLFLLLPYHYRLLSSAASHLKRWISVKAHLFPGGAARSRMESASAEPQQRAIGLLDPAEGRRALAALEEQLGEALRRGEPPSTLVRRYYLPMFAAAVSTGDVARAQRVRKKLEAAEIPDSELPGWLNVSFNFALAQYRLDAARETAERHLCWAQERNDSLEEAVACFNLGCLAQEQRDFAGAEQWCLKSLAIFEKQRDEHLAAITYHSLGMIAQKQRDFAGAERWYRKSLAIFEKQRDEHLAAITYHSLGRIAQEQRDFAGAERWYRKSLAIFEKQGDEHGAAITYLSLGMIAEEQRDFAGAERWYLKSLAIKERQGNEHGAAITYHQLGRIAQEQRDFAGAERWYLKSLAIEEKQGNQHGAAITYHQLGIIAEEHRDFAGAERWYLKSLAIKEKQGDEYGAASTYHQLGIIAEEQRDFAEAERWYLKSLAIKEKQGDEHGAAMTYGQLGTMAQEQRDFAGAQRWYLKSLAIKEKQGNEHGAAITYHQLARLARERGDHLQSGELFLKAFSLFAASNDQHNAGVTLRNFGVLLRRAPPAASEELRALGLKTLGPELMGQVERAVKDGEKA